MTLPSFRRRTRASLRAAVAAALIPSVLAVAASPAVAVGANDCDDAIAAANLLNEAADYAAALAAFDAIVEECDSKDERHAIQTGRAHSLNHLQRYDEAIGAANMVLAEDELHLFALFERAYAYEHQGNMEAATADYELIARTADTNVHTAERATIHAKLAELYYKSGKPEEARQNLDKAKELDPTNPLYVVLEGDWAVKEGNWAAADAAYAQAATMGTTEAEIYQIRSEASMKMVQDKYGTTNAQELRASMTPEETALVCSDAKKALAMGWKNPQMDMFVALVCQ